MKGVKNDADDATEEDEGGDEIAGIVEEDNAEEDDSKDGTDLGGSGLGLHNPRSQSDINRKMPFPPSDLVRSVVQQLKVELKQMYKKGTCNLHKMLKKRIDKRQLDKSKEVIKIRGDLSAIENYLALNKLSPNPRRIVPMTSLKQPY
ncbi:hypothetical protein DFQ29_003710, partial [Apophysomyces sp. BC1021]